MKNKSIIIAVITSLVITLTTVSTVTAHPPRWAPAHGFRGQTGFIYFPEHNFYYDIPRGGYFFYDGGNWKFGMELPLMFSHFDLRMARKVHYREYCESPFFFNKSHRMNGCGRHNDLDRRHDRWDDDRHRHHDRRDEGRRHHHDKHEKGNKHHNGKR
jgi:hypothetical protein